MATRSGAHGEGRAGRSRSSLFVFFLGSQGEPRERRRVLGLGRVPFPGGRTPRAGAGAGAGSREAPLCASGGAKLVGGRGLCWTPRRPRTPVGRSHLLTPPESAKSRKMFPVGATVCAGG